MKIVYFGTSEFAVPTLQRLHRHIALVVSQPDQRRGRGMKMDESAVKKAALELGLPVETPEKAKDSGFIDFIQKQNADFNLVAAYGQILSQRLLDSSLQGSFNLHGSILPAYRGAAPIQRAIENGDTETGITLMKMDRGMDTGALIAISKTAIDPDETYGELQARLAEIAADMAEFHCKSLAEGKFEVEAQNNDFATYAPKIDRLESELLFEMTGLTAYRKYRALSPHPGAYVVSKWGRIKILKAVFPELQKGQDQLEPGTAGWQNGVLKFGFAESPIIVLALQMEGKKAVTSREWAAGMRLNEGDQFSLMEDNSA